MSRVGSAFSYESPVKSQCAGDCCAARFRDARCPLWVIFVRSARCRRSRHVRFTSKSVQPLAPQRIAASCQKRPNALQQTATRPSLLRRRSAGSPGSSQTSRTQRGGSPNILRITLSASASKHRPWLSKIRCGCHEWIFLIAASAFCRWRSSGNRMPKKI
jgi:hypothetical protein